MIIHLSFEIIFDVQIATLSSKVAYFRYTKLCCIDCRIYIYIVVLKDYKLVMIHLLIIICTKMERI